MRSSNYILHSKTISFTAISQDLFKFLCFRGNIYVLIRYSDLKVSAKTFMFKECSVLVWLDWNSTRFQRRFPYFKLALTDLFTLFTSTPILFEVLPGQLTGI